MKANSLHILKARLIRSAAGWWRMAVLCLAAAAPTIMNAQVRWLETTHNFGAFNEKMGTVSCNMQFVNESNRPVIINQVHVTCGCTSPTYDHNPVEPGDTGSVTLAYNPDGRPGRFEKRVYVDLNTTPSRYTLWIKGSVIGSPTTVNERYPASFGPLRMAASMVPFGEVVKGKSKTIFLEVYNNSSDVVLPRWTDLPKHISVGVPRDSVYPGENIAYTFILASDKIKEYGLNTDTITLVAATPDGREERFPVTVMAMINEDFSRMLPGQVQKAPIITIDPRRVNVGPLSRGDAPVTVEIPVKNDGNDPLLLRRVYSGDTGIAPAMKTAKIKKGKQGYITVTVDPSAIVGDVLNARVVVICNDPLEPVVNLNIVGEIKP